MMWGVVRGRFSGLRVGSVYFLPRCRLTAGCRLAPDRRGVRRGLVEGRVGCNTLGNRAGLVVSFVGVRAIR